VDQEVVNRFLKGDANQEEVREVLKWYYSDEADYILSEKVEQLWEEYKSPQGNTKFPKPEVLQMIKQKISRLEGYTSVKAGKTFGKRIGIYYKMAATVVLMLSLGLALYKWTSIESFKAGHSQLAVANEMITKTTAKGQKFTIFLGDNTRVKLNSESSLQYPANFSGLERVVYLTGEAFFEVESDPLRPFSVISNDLVITALGTAFNINAYPGQDQITVSLAEGVVKINPKEIKSKPDHSTHFELLLEPGTQAVYSTTDYTVHTKDFNARKALSWKDGIIFFEDATWKTVVNELERWYGVEFVIRNQPMVDKLYTGSFNNQSLKNVLESLGFSKNFNFLIDGHKVYLTFNIK
jgi:transmembrane sensor